MATAKHTYVDFKSTRPVMLENDQTVASVSDTAVNYLKLDGVTFEVHNDGQNDALDFLPIDDADCTSGLEIPLDGADNDGIEITQGILADAGARHVFTVGTDAAFQLVLKMGIPVVADYDVIAVGFRKAGAYDADIASEAGLEGGDYTDFACFNINNGDIKLITRLNNGTATTTDTTDNWANDAVKTLAVKVSGAGVVTYTVDGSAPTTVAAFTFDTGDELIPFIRFAKRQNGVTTNPILSTYQCALQ